MIKNENEIEGEIDPFKVYVRVRPLLERELSLIEATYQENNLNTSGGRIISKNAIIAEDNMVCSYILIITT
jgi:hypothetical protein